MKITKLNLLFSFFLGLFFVGSVQLHAQDNLKEAASNFIKLIEKEDYLNMAEESYPKYLELNGGVKELAERLSLNKQGLKQLGFTFESAVFDSIEQVVETPDNTQAIVSYTYVHVLNGDRYVGKGYVFAIKGKDTNRWTFVELETFDEASIKDFVPVYSDKLIFPEIRGAVFEKSK